jgi:hypothetical protein
MTRAALEAQRLALLAEGESLEKEYDRLRLTPPDSPEHAAYRERLRRHRERVRNYFRELRRRQDDVPCGHAIRLQNRRELQTG